MEDCKIPAFRAPLYGRGPDIAFAGLGVPLDKKNRHNPAQIVSSPNFSMTVISSI
jgi:hypothetical protein